MLKGLNTQKTGTVLFFKPSHCSPNIAPHVCIRLENLCSDTGVWFTCTQTKGNLESGHYGVCPIIYND